jgi:hypothetical protein
MKILSIFIYLVFLISCQSANKKTKETSVDSNLSQISDLGLKGDRMGIPIFASGIYQDISLAYDSSSKIVTGVYQYYDNWDEKYKEYLNVNVFYFFGIVNQNKTINIKGAWPTNKQQLNGKLSNNQNNDSIFIGLHLDQQPLGYNDVDFTNNNGALMNLESLKKWIQIRIVKSPVAGLFNSPDSSALRKGYLVKTDIVKVFSKSENGWYNIEYNPKNNNSKSTIVWMREEDLYDIDPMKW